VNLLVRYHGMRRVSRARILPPGAGIHLVRGLEGMSAGRAGEAAHRRQATTLLRPRACTKARASEQDRKRMGRRGRLLPAGHAARSTLSTSAGGSGGNSPRCVANGLRSRTPAPGRRRRGRVEGCGCGPQPCLCMVLSKA
jgi:hypothetical protein